MTETPIALTKDNIDANPIRQFRRWYDEVRANGVSEQDAISMTLATANREGCPSARIVLLKSFSDLGFVFFTNYLSRKAKELSENPCASLLFTGPSFGGKCESRATSRRFPPQSLKSISRAGRWEASSAPGLQTRAKSSTIATRWKPALPNSKNALANKFPDQSIGAVIASGQTRSSSGKAAITVCTIGCGTGYRKMVHG